MILKNGLFYEDDELIYYRNGVPTHAGVIRIDEDIYYIGTGGKARKGQKNVHREMSNGILEHGTYTFGEDYKLIPDSYIAARKGKRKKLQGQEKTKKARSIWRFIKHIEHKERIAAALLMVVLVLGLVFVASRYKGGSVPKQSPSAMQNTNAKPSEKDTVTTPEKDTVTTTEKDTVTTTEKETVNGTTNETVNEAVNGKVRVTLPQYSEDVLLCSKEAKMEYDGKVALEAVAKSGDPYRPFVFEYSFTNCSGTLWLGEREDLSDATQYALPESQKSVTIHNLKVDTDYYYKVLVAGQEYLGSFHTALSTRFFYIPGLENTRDIGGGTTLDGRRVKQGMIIRGVEPDGLATVENFIPDDMVEQVQREYDFAYDMDLRAKRIYIGEFTSRLGIPHDFYYGPQYGETFHSGFRTALKRIFSDMANPENYPMYLHCTWGRDRTGTIVYLLQGVLNMSEEDMVQDYRRSAYWFSKIANSEDMKVVIAGLEPYAGDTLQEKIVTFLITEIGVTEEEIASIRAILLE